jgi:hypothetical protein
MRATVLPLVALLALPGCKGKEAQAKLDALSKQGRAKLALLGPVATKVKSLPAVTRDSLTYSGPPLTKATTVDAGNTAVVDAGTLFAAAKMPAPPDPTAYVSIGDPPWQISLALMDQGKPYPGTDAASVETTFRGTLGLEYVLVVRRTSVTKPVLQGDGYTAGSYAGEANLFALADAKYLGGFRFQASSSNKVQVRSKAGSNDAVQAHDAEQMLEADFDQEIHTALTSGLHKYVPSAVVKYPSQW